MSSNVVTATNAPANEFLTREILESMNPQAIRKLARERFSMSMPFAFQKPDLVQAVLDQLAPAETLEPETPEIPANPAPEPIETPAPANVASEAPEALTPTLTREEVAAKLAKHRERLDQEKQERAVEAATKRTYQSWQPTADELVKRAGRLAYSVGALLTAQNRLRKETRVLRQVLEAMGELVDRDALLKAKQKMIEQYAHVQDRGCFPSPALASAMKGEELRAAVWAELCAAGIPLQVAQLLGDQPDDIMVPFLLDVLASSDDADDEE